MKVDPWLYLAPSLLGRTIRLVWTAIQGSALSTSGSFAVASFGGGVVVLMARYFWKGSLVWYATQAAAAFLFCDSALMPNCQPPTQPVAWPLGPLGRAAKPNLPTTLEFFGSANSEYTYGQLRMNAAWPLPNALRASSSAKAVTPDGEILPIQLWASLRTAIVFGLSTVTLPFSMTVPAP